MNEEKITLDELPVTVSSQVKLGELMAKVNRKLKKVGYQYVLIKTPTEEQGE